MRNPLKRHKHHLNGWKKDAPDSRDCVFSVPRDAQLPISVDLRLTMKPVGIEDQGQIGSCTANALVGIMEHLYNVSTGSTADFARLYLYYGERYIENTIKQDGGAQIRTGVKVLSKQGVCTESLWPYDAKNLYSMPPHACFDDALKHRAVKYERITSLTGMKYMLSKRMPVAFGFTVFSSFESDAVARTGNVPMPKLTGWFKERIEGGHAVLAIGYDDERRFNGPSGKPLGKGCCLCRNSWGDKFGDGGHFWLPYPFFQSPDMSDDFWAITEANFLP